MTTLERPRVLLDGIAMGESPRWHEGRLWFCDWLAEEIVAVDETGVRETIAGGVGALPLCIDWDLGGRLLLVSGRTGKLLRRQDDRSFAEMADLAALNPFPWNEITVDAHGNAFVNGIGFDFPSGTVRTGQVAVVRPDWSATIVAEDLAFPNGMAITPDGRQLLVAESYASRITAFAIGPDGSLSDRRTWAALDGDHPDGICLDAEGSLWYADVGTRRCVRVREGGNVLQEIELDRGCFACELGGADGRTLFLVANAWSGPSGMASSERTGQILTIRAPARAPTRR